jgi:polyribonucleotide nucleotidyltransferase
MIKDIVEDLEIGQVYEWLIARIEDYWLFIKLPKNKMWLCHVSSLWPIFGKDLTKQFKIWDKMKVKITEIDDQWRLKVKREIESTTTPTVPTSPVVATPTPMMPTAI